MPLTKITGGEFDNTQGGLIVAGIITASSNLLVSGNLSVGPSGSYMNVTSSGVGIGTLTPQERVHIFNSASSNYIRLDNPSGTAYYGLNSSGDTEIIAATNNNLIFKTFGTERARIDSSARLGIGTTNPSASLDVNGGIRARGGSPGALGVNNNGYAFSGSGDNDSGMFSSADGQIEFYTNSTEKIKINSSGNLQLSSAGTKVLNSSGNPILQQTGSILQVSWKDLGSSSFTATSTSSTYRATGFTNTITPGASTSKILHTVTIGCQFICDGNLAIARGGTVVSPSLMDSYRDGITASYSVDMPAYTFTWLDSPATTSACNYELYCRCTGCSGTMFVGSSGDFTSSWTLMEVAA
jgi:hypothetical protein